MPDVTRFSNWPDAPSKAQVERSLRWMSKVHASGKGCAWIIEIAARKGSLGAVLIWCPRAAHEFQICPLPNLFDDVYRIV